MIGLDTNILVRYFAQDDARQAKRAAEIIESELSAETPGFIGSIVLVELHWVLVSCYEMSPEASMTIIRELITAEDIEVEHREATWKALRLAAEEKLDFADALLGCIHREHGCEVTVTFDRKAAKSALFKAA